MSEGQLFLLKGWRRSPAVLAAKIIAIHTSVHTSGTSWDHPTLINCQPQKLAFVCQSANRVDLILDLLHIKVKRVPVLRVYCWGMLVDSSLRRVNCAIMYR